MQGLLKNVSELPFHFRAQRPKHGGRPRTQHVKTLTPCITVRAGVQSQPGLPTPASCSRVLCGLLQWLDSLDSCHHTGTWTDPQPSCDAVGSWLLREFGEGTNTRRGLSFPVSLSLCSSAPQINRKTKAKQQVSLGQNCPGTSAGLGQLFM